MGGDGAYGGTLQDFLSIAPSVDGQFNDRDADEEYITWIETFRKAYNEGYITNDQFSDNDNTMKRKTRTRAIFCLPAYEYEGTQ